MTDLQLAASIVSKALRERQAAFLKGALTADPKLAEILREFAGQDRAMADLLEAAVRNDKGDDE